MLDTLKKLFQNSGNSRDASQPQLSQAQVQMACAALLVEVAVIDSHFDDTELQALKHIIHAEFKLENDEIDQLIDDAHKASHTSTSMYQFTRLVNDHCGFEDKYTLIRNMWLIAYADCNIDKYEEFIIRKVSELIHVSHGDFIRAKIEARTPPSSN